MTLRCFIGLPLPRLYQEKMAAIIKVGKQEIKSKLNWTQPQNWHLTLKFLGNVSQDLLPGINAQLSQIDMQKFDFQAGGGGFFPSIRRPKVIWVGVQKGAALCKYLAQEIEKKLSPLGFVPEKRAFSAHLTLARIKWAKNDAWDDWLHYLNSIEWAETEMDRFVLWKSELSAQGPFYTRLHEYKLRA